MTSPADPERRWTRRQFLTAAGIVAVGGASVAVIYAVESQGQPSAGSTAAVPSAAAVSAPLSSTVLSAVASPTPAPSVTAGTPTHTTPATPGPSGSAPPTGPRRTFRSRPDLTPPVIEIATPAGAVAPGYIFFTPGNGAGRDGPMIVDNAGEPIWVHPGAGKAATDFRVSTYHGAPVLTWWEGTLNGGNGDGQFIVADAGYQELTRIRPVNGYSLDLHELVVTPAGTALFLAGNPMLADAAIGRPWALWDDVIQEVDIATGHLLFEWHTAQHIDPSESFVAPPTKPTDAYDAVHANSIEIDTDGNLIVSARNTSAIYKIDRVTGEIHWRLGGKKSDFSLGPGAAFGWQHDVRRLPDGTISIFDDEAAPNPSRGIILEVDEVNRTATLRQEFKQPHHLPTSSQGNVQLLPNGNWFIGWGATPWFSEFAPDGTVIFDASFPASGQSYRSYRLPWVSHPTELPALSSEVSGTNLTVYASWNGATEVATWDVLAGPQADTLDLVGSAPRTGFETSITVASNGQLVAVRARDKNGASLATSAALPIGS